MSLIRWFACFLLLCSVGGYSPLLFAATDCRAVTEIPQSECESLLAFYQATDGDNWRNNAGWMQTNTPCSWHGISCDNGHVKQISLSVNGLSGEVPDILNLPQLTRLFLSNNDISKIPDFANLPQLTLLGLYACKLSEVPDFSNLPQLKQLYLGGNNLSGKIPFFSYLPQLGVLSLRENELTGQIPDFSNFPKLSTLNLSHNNLEGKLTNILASLKNLQLRNLYLNGNDLITGEIPDISYFPQLASLSLGGKGLIGEVPNFSYIPKLRYLSLRGENLTGAIPDFNNLQNLDILRIQNTSMDGSIPKFKLPKLNGLNLNFNNLSGTIPDFSNMPNLGRLDLNNNNLSGAIPDFSDLPKLGVLDLANNNLSGAIPDFSDLPKLGVLDLANNNLSGAIPDFSNIPNLGYMGFGKNNLSGTIPQFLKLTKLTIIYLHENNLSGQIPDLSHIAPQISGTLWLNDNQLTGEIPTFIRLLNPIYAGPRLANNDLCHNPNSDYGHLQYMVRRYPACNGTENTEFACTQVTQIPTQECQSLVTLYQQTNGDNWTNNGNWQQTNTPCDWYGITCENGHIQHISLTNNALEGQLPALELPNLTMLLLAGNTLTGSFPHLTNMPALTELNLAANQLSGSIPNIALPKLSTLFIENNQLTGLIPTFKAAPALQTLDISGNALCADPKADYGQWQTQVSPYPECQRTLKVKKTNTGQGQVTASDGSIDCGLDCQFQKVAYDPTIPAPSITLTATPAAGASFLKWRAACQGNTPTTQVTVDKATLCVAEFGLNTGKQLNVVKTGQGSGVVRSPFNTIYCTKHCIQDQATYAADTQVTLIAKAAPGSTFTTWSGDCNGDQPTTTFSMDADKNCAAIFTVTSPPPQNMHTLTLQIDANTNTDSITSTSPNGINCPNDCTENYRKDQRVNLQAFPHSTSQFTGWSGDCQNSGTVELKRFVIMDGDKTCTAHFANQ